jgi:mono/diheme cytochrome c family protein
MRRSRRLAIFAALPIGAVVLVACGSQGVQVADNSAYHTGAEIFAARCSGCHTLSAAGAQGSATNVKQRERTDGPNFDQRKESSVSDVVYAIRNGGFSGAIMPQNIVVGDEAQEVAKFVVACSGKDAKQPESPNAQQPKPPPAACTSGN